MADKLGLRPTPYRILTLDGGGVRGIILHACAGFFRARQGQLWQLVLCKRRRRQFYRQVR